MLRLNFVIDLARVSLDSDDEILVVAQAELRRIDGPGLERIADDVALLADEVAGIVLNAGTVPTEDVPDLTRSESTGGATLNLLAGHSEIHYDPSEWIEATPSTADITKQYQHRTGEVFVAVIAERVSIPAAALLGIALDNARDVAPDATATRRGSRLVNGVEVLFQEYRATSNGISVWVRRGAKVRPFLTPTSPASDARTPREG